MRQPVQDLAWWWQKERVCGNCLWVTSMFPSLIWPQCLLWLFHFSVTAAWPVPHIRKPQSLRNHFPWFHWLLLSKPLKIHLWGGRRGIYSLERKTIYFAQIILDTQFQRAATIVNFGITKEDSRDFKQKISNISIWFCAPLDILHPLVLNISPALRFVLHSCGPMTVLNIPLLLKVKRSIY